MLCHRRIMDPPVSPCSFLCLVFLSQINFFLLLHFKAVLQCGTVEFMLEVLDQFREQYKVQKVLSYAFMLIVIVRLIRFITFVRPLSVL